MQNNVILKFAKVRDVKTPEIGTSKSVGIDFFIPNDFIERQLAPLDRIIIPSGIHVDIPEGYYMQAGNKSGVSWKKGLTYGAGVIDEDYMGEIGIILVNTSPVHVDLYPGDKIIQFILTEYPKTYLVEYNSLEDMYIDKESDRGDGAYGHTGDK